MPDIDTILGRRVRHRRRTLGLTQAALADAVGTRFQQIQKYEAGINRMSASRLFEIAKFLQTPVAEFFADIELAAGA